MAEKLAHDLEWIADRSVRLYLRTVVVTGIRVAPPDLRAPSTRAQPPCAGSAGSRRTHAAPSTPSGSRAHVATLDPPWARLRGRASSTRTAGIAARRLAIIDLTGGDQPIANEDGSVVVVQNGEIYNYRELQHELERAGHTFRTPLRHRSARARLRGVGDEAVGAAARDVRRRGLGRAASGGSCWPATGSGSSRSTTATQAASSAFASELDALPHGDVDLDALEGFLAFNYVPGAAQRSSKTSASSCRATCSRGRTAARRSRRSRTRGRSRCRADDEAELVEECRARLRDSVRAHLVADVPVGVLLSGGVDSGTLAALAAEESSEPVRTFSIGFDEASFDELAGARAVAARYGTIHRELVAAPRRGAAPAGARRRVRRAVRRLVGAPDLPRLEARGRGRQGRAVRRGRATSSSAGTTPTSPTCSQSASAAPRPPPGLLADLLPSSSRRVSFDYKAKRFTRSAHLPPLERHHGWKEIFSADARAELHRPHLGVRSARRLPRAVRRRPTGTSSSPASRTSTSGCTWSTTCSRRRTARRWHGRSRRASRSWTRSSPTSRSRCPRGTRCAASRRSGSSVAPSSRCCPTRSSTGGSAASRSPRLHGCAVSWSRSRGRRSPRARCAGRGSSNRQAVTRLLDAHVSGKEDLSRQLWGLLAFTLWHEHHVEGIARDVPLAAVTA